MDPETPAKTTIYHSHEICIMTSSHNDGRRKCPQSIQARLELILLFTNCLQYYVDVIRLGIYMFVHDNNVSVSCTVPLLTLHKAAYLQIAYGKLHSATFQQYTLVSLG